MGNYTRISEADIFRIPDPKYNTNNGIKPSFEITDSISIDTAKPIKFNEINFHCTILFFF